MASLLALATYLAAFAALASGSCIHGTSLMKRADASYGYHGTRGPLTWYNLDPAKNEKCAKGKNQTPIDLRPGSSAGVTTLGAGARPVLNYPAAAGGAKFENLGTTVQVTAGGTMTIGGVNYTLRQFHFHTPSEHHLNQEHFGLEVHFVHEKTEALADGSKPLAVLGGFFEVTADETRPDLFRTVLGRVNEIAQPGSSIQTARLGFEPVARHFAENDVYRYSGSLTTPPCSENVAWFVSSRPFRIDVATYNAVKRVVKFNSRYTQNELGQDNLLVVAARLLCPA